MRKIFNITLLLFMLLGPLMIYADFDVGLVRNIFFCFGSLTLFIMTLNMRPVRNLCGMYPMLCGLFFLIRTISLSNVSSADWFNFWVAMPSFFYILCGILLFRSVYCYVETPKALLWPIALICCCNVFLVILQMGGHDFMWKHTSPFNHICGSFTLPQQLSQYASIAMPLVYWIHPGLIVFPLFLLLMAQEITGICASGIGLLFILWNRNKQEYLYLVVTCFIMLGVIFHHQLMVKWYTRPVTWKQAIEKIAERPLLGHGYNTTSAVMGHAAILRFGKYQNADLFSDYFQTALEFGGMITIWILLFFGQLFMRFRKIRGKSSLLLYLGTSVFVGCVIMAGQSMIRHADVSSLFIILLAFLCIQIEEEYHAGRI